MISHQYSERPRLPGAPPMHPDRHGVVIGAVSRGVIYFGSDGTIVEANPAAEGILGIPFGELEGLASLDPWWKTIREDGSDLPVEERPAGLVLRTGTEVRGMIVGLRSVDAVDTRWLRAHAFPIYRTGDEGVHQVCVTFEDVTEIRKLEEELRQAQKMESMGHLMGGVVHDFNNLLTVILGNTLMALADRAAADPVNEDLREIRKAAESATALTRHLLTYSRRKGPDRRAIAPSRVVASVEPMLRRVIGEDIILTTRSRYSEGLVEADAGQIEQAILNLAINARDAMPGGGTLTLEVNDVELTAGQARAAEVPEGAFVEIRVSDTGCGMDAATLARIGEPFFTTKAAGRGTGLGLTTTYRTVRENGGGLCVESEPGRGTTFRIYLPRIDEEPIVEEDFAPDHLARGSERILFVEDDAGVRELNRRVLERAGYSVEAAEGAHEALYILERQGGLFDLVITDVILPEMSGPELANRVSARWPDIRILFTSGYSEEEIVRRGAGVPGPRLLPKPFHPATLAEWVRETLDDELAAVG